MLTLRIHLDAMTGTNGPLLVLNGSHREDRPEHATSMTPDAAAAVEIHTEAGAVFAMRPRLLHCSRAAATETDEHRRVLHLEFAASPKLPGQYQWHTFHSLNRSASAS